MDTLSAVFSTVWDSLTGAAWFQYIKWPFWACLILIAVGGVYNARFQKNTLFCRGITGTMKLSLIYLAIVFLYRVFPTHMSTVSQYPFLSMSESAMTLVNPLKLFDRPLGAMAQLLVRLYFLLFLVNIGGSIDYSGKNPLSWAGSQLLSCSIAVGFYEIITGAVTKVLFKLHMNAPLFYIIVAACLLLPLCILLTMKLYFIVFRKGGNPTYGAIMKFLTAHKFGTLFSVSFFSMISSLVLLIAVNIGGYARISITNFSWFAYLLIVAMCGGTLFVFSLYYTERKAA